VTAHTHSSQFHGGGAIAIAITIAATIAAVARQLWPHSAVPVQVTLQGILILVNALQAVGLGLGSSKVKGALVCFDHASDAGVQALNKDVTQDSIRDAWQVEYDLIKLRDVFLY
jgi:hypothetical protein